jgi:hypothetical protein
MTTPIATPIAERAVGQSTELAQLYRDFESENLTISSLHSCHWARKKASPPGR